MTVVIVRRGGSRHRRGRMRNDSPAIIVSVSGSRPSFLTAPIALACGPKPLWSAQEPPFPLRLVRYVVYRQHPLRAIQVYVGHRIACAQPSGDRIETVFPTVEYSSSYTSVRASEG